MPQSGEPVVAQDRAHDAVARQGERREAGQEDAAGRTSGSEPLDRVVIVPRVPRAGDTLTAEVEPHDPVGAAFLTYRWFVNGEEISQWRRETFAGRFQRGDQISVAVRRADRSLEDSTFTDSVRVVNAPPHVRDLESPRFENGTYRTRIVATDPDGDSLSFAIVQAPEGLVIDGRGGIAWEPREQDFGKHEVVVSVRDDAGGEIVYTYAFSIGHP